ncbi:hypothetical protein BJ878DRAFT_413886, partial [Calycina marina]
TVRYEVLSCCWGDPKLGNITLVNWCVLRVTDSLYSFLTHCCYPEGFVWIKGTCIDHRDFKERE